ncbi:MAG: 5-(carboxyamino)imidazole ribonucleotide mutase [Bacteroidetes bacterium]|nr:5-(carboxyamino)imidazole ribonucleotide mutase [Bacteroidota bacterium]
MPSPRVGVAMGSESDLPTMQGAIDTLRDFDVSFERRVLSAHRTPQRMLTYAQEARSRGLRVLIGGAGGAAHLPGMLAAATTLPVIGVPVKSSKLSGLDSLLSIVQMPTGVPVATVAIGGAANAALLAVQILSLSDPALADALDAYKDGLTEKVDGMDARVQQA